MRARWWTTAAVAALLAFLSVAPAGAATTPGWRITQTLASNTYGMVTALSGSDAWAATVTTASPSSTVGAVMVRHWTGTTWAAITVPTAMRSGIETSRVAATSASDAWVFASNPSSGITYLAHWNGSTWNRVVQVTGHVYNIVALSSANYWAFGQTSTWHYTGSAWQSAPGPSEVQTAAAAGGSVWTLGYVYSPAGDSLLAEHLVAGKWAVVATPTFPGDSAVAFSVTATSAANVWVIAWLIPVSSGLSSVLVLHYNGTTWTHVSVPAADGNFPWSIASDGSGGVWLSTSELSSSPASYALHYAGGTFTRITLPAATGRISTAYSLALIPGTRSLWGVGVEGSLTSTAINGIILKYGS